MDALKTEKLYTIEDIYALPEGKRAELIDGRRQGVLDRRLGKADGVGVCI